MMMPAAPPPGYGHGHPVQGRSRAEKTRTWILFGLLVVATGGVIIMLASDKKSKGIDCDAYVEKSVALATAGRTGADLDEMTRRVTSIAENNCMGGSVSEEEAECVETSATHDELLRCLGLGGAK